MGLMDKLKKMANAVTGGAAEVQVKLEAATMGKPFLVKVTTRVSDADLEIKRAYILIRAEEETRVKNVPKIAEGDIRETETPPIPQPEHEVYEVETYRTEIEVTGGETLAAGQEYTWTAEITIPEGNLPTYRGHNCSHVWALQAGLDTFGNDPDSGWVEFAVT